jgi:hypothetical protein
LAYGFAFLWFSWNIVRVWFRRWMITDEGIDFSVIIFITLEWISVNGDVFVISVVKKLFV